MVFSRCARQAKVRWLGRSVGAMLRGVVEVVGTTYFIPEKVLLEATGGGGYRCA